MTHRTPYIRPGELGTSTETLTIRIVQDGTRAVAEVYRGDEEYARYGQPVGVGHASRRKGDKRNPTLGASLAMARALASASENVMQAVREEFGE